MYMTCLLVYLLGSLRLYWAYVERMEDKMRTTIILWLFRGYICCLRFRRLLVCLLACVAYLFACSVACMPVCVP